MCPRNCPGNTFAPHLASLDAFQRADSWPALTTGDALFATMQGLNIPLSGFNQRAQQDGHKLHPLCWCSAEPSSYVTREAFEHVAELICAPLADIDGLDAVYLDLHGAMVTEDYEDGEGELLRRVRAVVGPSIPIVISLDLHVNLTRGMLEHCDAMTIYRTYPQSNGTHRTFVPHFKLVNTQPFYFGKLICINAMN